MDQWPAYEFERRRVLTHFRETKVKNPVVLTGDIHTNWANELYTDFDGSQGKSVGVEFVGTSIASGGDGEDMPKSRKSTPDENPCVKFLNGDRGYVRCEVTPKQWRTDYQIVPYITRPGAPLKTRASFVVESGTPRLQKA